MPTRNGHDRKRQCDAIGAGLARPRHDGGLVDAVEAGDRGGCGVSDRSTPARYGIRSRRGVGGFRNIVRAGRDSGCRRRRKPVALPCLVPAGV